MSLRPVTIEDTRVVTHEAASEARAETDRPGGFYARLEAAEAENALLRARLATAEAERDRLLRQIARVRACPCISGTSCDELGTLYDLAASRAPSTGTTPP